jgi:uncharacterized protein
MMDEPFYSVGPRAVTLRVKAKPHAHEDSVLGARAGALVVAVRAVAEKGKANAEIVKVLATALGVSREQVVLKSGGSASHKVFIVPLEALKALERLAAAPH